MATHVFKKEQSISMQTKKIKKMETKRLVLRPYQKSDYAAWKQNRLNRGPATSRFDSEPKTLEQCSRSEFNKQHKTHIQNAKEDKLYVFGIFLKATGELIGQINITTIYRENRQIADFGYVIDKQFQKKGFGKEASIAGLQIAFAVLGFQRIEATIDRGNRGSIRLAKSIGMKKEGLKRKYIIENGKWIDQIVYSAIPEDIGLTSSPPRKFSKT